MRSFPGAEAAASPNDRSGGGACARSVGTLPMVVSYISAASATPRVSHPATLIPCQCSDSGASETRPRCGLSPNRPLLDAGKRIEPAPSVPRAAPTRPAATAAPEPPLEPPGVRLTSQGLRVMPQVGDSVHGIAHSGGT